MCESIRFGTAMFFSAVYRSSATVRLQIGPMLRKPVKLGVQFFAQAGLDYVSCSPFRVPVARVAAAQVAAKSDAAPLAARACRPQLPRARRC